ncbi:hypothetical protein JZ751_029310 [Albula glossodonta]|uniref:Uncharacterized protein n=1 Tax=Albula glossodonta TaxID=121402 RepID=A0A8T2P650_9TELE|nr:hypothetical protein JZ751_029310 [Albula glossodonta]
MAPLRRRGYRRSLSALYIRIYQTVIGQSACKTHKARYSGNNWGATAKLQIAPFCFSRVPHPQNSDVTPLGIRRPGGPGVAKRREGEKRGSPSLEYRCT